VAYERWRLLTELATAMRDSEECMRRAVRGPKINAKHSSRCPREVIAFSELVQAKSTRQGGFSPRKKPPCTSLKKSACIPEML